MTLTASDAVIAIILISCVPLQYYLVQNWGSSESTRSFMINKLTTHLTKFYEKYLQLDSWREWLLQVLNISDTSALYDNDYDDPEGFSPAVEVIQLNQAKGYFGMSTEPRNLRSPKIKFRIGQVILHKRHKYRGVIVGWDEVARGPKQWIAELDAQNKRWKHQANYAILVDTRDRLIPHLTYVPQENLEKVQTKKIFHPLVENYFEQFDGNQYIPRPWIQKIYPQD